MSSTYISNFTYMDIAFFHLRNGAMAMGRDGLHKPRRSHFFTEIVMSICGQPIIAINKGHKGEGFRQAGELQLLRVKTNIQNGYLSRLRDQDPCIRYLYFVLITLCDWAVPCP